jgi:hypothetical protein
MPFFNLLAVDNFDAVRSIAPRDVASDAIATIRSLDEKEEIEPWVQSILHDTNRTSHGPSEIVDIFTHKLSVRGKPGLAAFILKGKSFPTVRPVHVSHQIFRLERLQDLSFAILGASGNVLDEVREQFVSTAKRLHCDYSILDAHDLARLLLPSGSSAHEMVNALVAGDAAAGILPRIGRPMCFSKTRFGN